MTLKRVTRTDVLIAVGAAIAGLAYFLSYYRFGYMEDEGYLVEGVMRVMDGQVIYRDFHHTYAPGRFYLFALLFSIFGKNLLVVRATWAVLLAVKAGLAYWVGCKLTSRPFALMLAVLVTLLPGPWHKTLFSFSAYLLLAGMVLLVERPGVRSHVLAGLLTGLMALFRQDVAGFAAIGILAIGIVRALGGADRREGRSFLRQMIAYGIGLLLVIGPVVIAFHAAGGLGSMVRSTLVEGMRDNRTNQLPFPTLWPATDYARAHGPATIFLKLLFYLAPVAFALTGAVLIVRVFRRTAGRGDLFLLGALVLAVGCFNQSVWRSDLPHLYQSLQPAYLLTAVLLYTLFSALQSRLRAAAGRWILGIVLVVFLPLVVCGPVYWVCGQLTDVNSFYALRKEGLYARSVEYTGSALVRRDKTTRLPLERAPLIVNEWRARHLEMVGRYLDENTLPGDSILSVPGFQMVYFLFDRKNPTRYIHLRRSLGSAQEERNFIQDVMEADTKVILFTDIAIDGKRERRFQIYARNIYDWIMENYEYDGAVGHLAFMKPRRTGK
ncbi:MAG: hypothetical protein KAW17_00560 [Candidatus Eisenbacteria sp.]|nr:hypothetical protein [Candidatus Eisenbacteria bacterium]